MIIIIDKIREEVISEINVSTVDFTDGGTIQNIKDKFKHEILVLIKKYIPSADRETSDLLVNELLRQNIGLGDLEILLKDDLLEEIVVNGSKEPVMIYHKEFGWLKTNVLMQSENSIRHFSTVIGSDVGKEITLLKPYMKAQLLTEER